MTDDIVSLNPTARFSSRAENYVKYRPSYPDAIIPFLEKNISLQKNHRVADIGSGTGLFSELLLKNGYHVVGIEPNEEMRKAAEKRLAHFPGFSSRNHRAEQTGLRSASVDVLTIAQAFHWMEPAPTKKEFLRILKPGGHIVLAWNIRLSHTPFLKAYEELKHRHGIDNKSARMVSEDAIKLFYDPREMKLQSFDNLQMLDFEGLKGQLLSSSYIALPGHPKYDKMIEELVQLFIEHNEKGHIKMQYETKLYFNN